MTSATIFETEILVIGAGMAGITAALSAAETGSSTILIDRNPSPGGLATAAMVGTFCGLYLRNSERPQWAFKGPARALAEEITVACSIRAESWKHGLHFLPYPPHILRKFLHSKLSESRIQYIPGGLVDALTVENRQLREVHGHTSHANITIRPTCVIDASGFALVHEKVGLPTMPEVEHQAAALSFILSGLPD
ncbi:MAG: FAD-dependent oxidoreductase, partial [Verrucomicrobia bacterium]|nr:FAD-dependent oxidoreductase [Verrucomicrobiota bacterium]